MAGHIGRNFRTQRPSQEIQIANCVQYLMTYRLILESASAPPGLRRQAEYKAGRCQEKLGRTAEAVEYYMGVVYGWLDERESGRELDATWFTRAAFGAAALKEAAILDLFFGLNGDLEFSDLELAQFCCL